MAKQKAPRQKHIPQRTCIACRETDAKRGLLRIVRDAEGRVSLDPTGKRAGRGAYLCHRPTCWEQALKRGALTRALRVEGIQPDDVEVLRAVAQRMVAEAADAPLTTVETE